MTPLNYVSAYPLVQTKENKSNLHTGQQLSTYLHKFSRELIGEELLFLLIVDR